MGDNQRFLALRWWAFETENCLPAPNFINCSNVSIRTVRPLAKPVLALGSGTQFIFCPGFIDIINSKFTKNS
jgi:hypothetical protein